MGAYFHVAYVTADLKRKINWLAGEHAIERLARCSLDEWPTELLEYVGLEDVADNPASAGVEEEKARVVEQLMADLAVFKEAMKDQRRDAFGGRIGNKRVVLSAGMSLGDAPTEAYESISRLEFAGVTKAIGFDW